MADTSPSAERRATRATNADQHPGLAVQNRKRRTKAEMARDRALLEEKKTEKSRQQTQSFERIAELEDRMAIDDAGAESAHPRNKKDVNERSQVKRKHTDVNNDNNIPPASEKTNQMEEQSAVIPKQKRKKVEDILTSSDDEPETPIVIATRASKKGDKRRKKGKSRAHTASTHAREQQKPGGEESTILTDLDITPQKKDERGKLRRSYAILDIAMVASNAAASEHEPQVSEHGRDRDDDDIYEDEPTPLAKKKQKAAKMPVREAINANRKEPQQRKPEDKPEVCDDSTPVSTKTSKTKYGIVSNWVNQVSKAGAKSLARTASSTTIVTGKRTTNSSNALVVSKTKIPNQESSHSHSHRDAEPPHEFLEEELEDEHEERKAALSSPNKGGKRLSSAGIVKLEHTTPPPSKRAAAGRKEKYTNAHLPPGCQDNGAWRRLFIPTYLQYLGSRDTDNDAWTVNDGEGISIQQHIWNFIYGDKVPHIITVQGPVFALVDQRVCEWRSGFASAALSIINAFFDDNDFESDDLRQDFAKSALESYTFLYRDISTTKDGETKRKGIFGGPFVVQTFTAHFSATQGAMNVPSIGDSNSSGPFVALALSAAAVERALTLWKDGSISCETVAELKAKKRSSAIIKTVNKATGKESSKLTDFNQANWATVTSGYFSSIKKTLSSPAKCDAIINAAKSFIKATSRTGDTGTLTSTVEQDLDERALLCDDDSD